MHLVYLIFYDINYRVVKGTKYESNEKEARNNITIWAINGLKTTICNMMEVEVEVLRLNSNPFSLLLTQ